MPLNEEEETELMISLLKDEWRQRVPFSLIDQFDRPDYKQWFIIIDEDRFIMVTPTFYIDEIDRALSDDIDKKYKFVRFNDCIVGCNYVDHIQYLELSHFRVVKRFLEELNAIQKM